MTLTLNQFSFQYNSQKTALSVENLSVEIGEKVVLVGQNGSGKTTLLHCLAGIHKGQKGTRTCAIEAGKISLVFQTPCLDKKLTVLENLQLFGKVWGLSSKQINQRLSQLSAVLALPEILDRDVGTLSGGQQRRADLARALLPEPALLFLDEPTTGLDLLNRREFWSILARAKASQPHLTLICASHHAAELEIFDRVIFLQEGQVKLDRKRTELVAELPKETLEIHTSSGTTLGKMLEAKHSLASIEVMHNRLQLHTPDATNTLTLLKNDNEIEQLIESTTVRKTSLADVVWQKLLSFNSTPSASPAQLNGLAGAGR